jgi:hypothetical protein
MRTRTILGMVAALGLASGIVLGSGAAANAVSHQGPGTDCFSVYTKTLTSTSTQGGANCTWTQAGIYRYQNGTPTLYVGSESLNSFVSNSFGVNAGNQGRTRAHGVTDAWASF